MEVWLGVFKTSLHFKLSEDDVRIEENILGTNTVDLAVSFDVEIRAEVWASNILLFAKRHSHVYPSQIFSSYIIAALIFYSYII